MESSVTKLRGMALLAATSAAVGTIVGLTIANSPAALGTVKHYKTVERTFLVRSNHVRVVDLKCPSGYVPVGGGGHVGSGAWVAEQPALAGISASDLDLTHKGWSVTAFVTSEQGNTSFTADVVCAVS
jgi:hypothetical protein